MAEADILDSADTSAADKAAADKAAADTKAADDKAAADKAAADTKAADDKTAADKKAADALEKGKGGDPSDELAGDLLSDDEDASQNASETSYEFDAPEDLKEVPFAPEALEAFKAEAGKLGLTQEQFQALAEFDLKNTQAAETSAVEAWHGKVKGWKAETLSDPDIGGEAFKETKVNVKAALGRFADKDLMGLIASPSEENPNGLAISNHPAFLRFVNRIGKALGDPEFHGGDEPLASEDGLKRMYPTMFKKDA